MAKCPKIEPIRKPSLFEMEKFEKAAGFVENLERPFCELDLFLGTSAFTAAGWSGTFYAEGMKSSDYLMRANSKQLRSIAPITGHHPHRR
jgi:hypothetical protein